MEERSLPKAPCGASGHGGAAKERSCTRSARSSVGLRSARRRSVALKGGGVRKREAVADLLRRWGPGRLLSFFRLSRFARYAGRGLPGVPGVVAVRKAGERSVARRAVPVGRARPRKGRREENRGCPSRALKKENSLPLAGKGVSGRPGNEGGRIPGREFARRNSL